MMAKVFVMSGFTLFDAVGFLGVAVSLGAYLALQSGLIRGQSYLYAGLNLVAAALVLIGLREGFGPAEMLALGAWIVISVLGMVRLYLIDRRVNFTEDERRFLAAKLPGLPKPSARRFLDAGYWVEGEPGTELAHEGARVDFLVYLAEGEAAVSQGGQFLASCEPGTLVGELTFMTDEKATATVVVTRPSRYFSIGIAQVTRLVEQDPEIASAVHRCFTGEARRKLVAANDRLRRYEQAAAAKARTV